MTDAINNDYNQDSEVRVVYLPPNAPLNFGALTKIATNLTPQSSPPSNPSKNWVYFDDGSNTESGHKGLRHYNGSSWDDLLGYTTEEIQDLINNLLQAGDKLSLTYDDSAGTLQVDTTALDAEEVEDQVSSLIVGGNSITATYDDVANTLTISTPAIENISEDTNPQLGGNLDVNEKSIGDGDNDTRIELEESTNENIIRFYVNGTEALNID